MMITFTCANIFLPLKKDSILVSQVPEKKCENRPVMLPRVKCEEVVVSRLHC